MRLVNYYHGIEGHRLAAAVKRLKALPITSRSIVSGGAFSVDDAHIEALRDIDEILQGHGVEYVLTDNKRWAAYYVNMGDTYSPTVMIQTRPRRSILVGRDWGSYVERYDR
jgi:hypothetical protein